jgi:putative CRISPR-associated protein (TIGR02620 family)
MIDLIVTRHSGLVEYLKEQGLVSDVVEVIAHATPEAVAGRHVCGVLPHSLSCLTASFTEVPLRLPPELRGKELSLEQLRQYAGKPVTYKVMVMKEGKL